MSSSETQIALDASVLPSSSSLDLLLVPTTPAEYKQTLYLNFEEWRGPLDLSQYFERERFLTCQNLTKNDGITAWILTSTTLPLHPDGTRPILSACETILKTAYVARNGKMEVVRAHGLGSVYTRPEYRGKGYAGRMIREVGGKLESHQQLNGDKGSFSVLFSDIGQQYYARHGWAAFSSTHIDLAPLGTEQFQRVRTQYVAVQDLTQEELKQLPVTGYLEERIKDVSKKSSNVPCLAIRPDLDHFDWHHAREEISTKLLGLSCPKIKGAVHVATGIALIWTRTFATNPQEWTLNVLHSVIPPRLRDDYSVEVQNAMAALLLRAQHEAHVWNMAAGVQVWDPSQLIISAAQKLLAEEQGQVEVVHRDQDHICSLRWIGARDGDKENNEVIWVSPEKYAWC